MSLNLNNGNEQMKEDENMNSRNDKIEILEIPKISFRERLRNPKFVAILALIAVTTIAIAYSSTMQLIIYAEYKQGHVYAQDQNMEKAVEYYRKAADHGYARAQYKLGICYANGEGVKKDMEAAARWWRRAAAQGHSHAKELLKKNGLSD
ncbi:MAG: hypothetical protein WCI51_20100 [Lentisphaerota bacterium]